MCISTQQLVRLVDGGDWDKPYSSGIRDGKNDSIIRNEMVSEWTDSGKWDGRKSVKVGNGMGSEWADSGTGREWDGNSSSCVGTGNAGTEISNGRGRETSIGKGNIATVPVPVPFPYRSDHFSRSDLYRAEPWKIQLYFLSLREFRGNCSSHLCVIIDTLVSQLAL